MDNEQSKELSKRQLQYIKNREARLAKAKEKRDSNIEECRKRERESYRRNRENKLEYHRKRRNNPEVVKKIRESNRRYYDKNIRKPKKILSEDEARARKERKKKANKEYRKRKLTKHPWYAIKLRIRRRINNALDRSGLPKHGKRRTMDVVGCTYVELRRHIESKFKPGMTWENRSEWHLDHIIPLSSARTKEEIYKLNHYTNLQPLWAEENQRKSDKMPGEY